MKKYFLSAILITIFVFLTCASRVEAQSASLYFDPSTQSASLNGSFSVSIMVNTGGSNVNGVTADFTYPSDILEVTSIDATDSEFSQELESNWTSTTVYISRGSSGGGSFNGTGEVATVNFTAIGSGTATLTFTTDATVTDTEASNVLGSTSSATITAGSAPVTGVFNKPMTFLIGFFSIVLICVGTLAILQYKKDYQKRFI